MALPSAQLGSMTSLNVPSGMPTVVTQPKEKYWQKILAQALAGAAGQAATQGVSNAMSKDYGSQMGEKDAGFWQRVGTGPNRNAQQFGQYTADKATDARAQTRMSFEELLAQKGQEFLAGQNTLDRDQRDRTANLGAQRDLQHLAERMGESQLNREYQTGADKERNRHLAAQTSSIETQNSINQQMLNDMMAARNTKAAVDRQAGVQAAAQSDRYVRPTDYAPSTTSAAIETIASAIKDAIPEAALGEASMLNNLTVEPSEAQQIMEEIMRLRRLGQDQAPAEAAATLDRVRMLTDQLKRTRQQ